MALRWLFVTLACVNTVRLQLIDPNEGSPYSGALNSDPNLYLPPIPYKSYANLPTSQNFDAYENAPNPDSTYYIQQDGFYNNDQNLRTERRAPDFQEKQDRPQYIQNQIPDANNRNVDDDTSKENYVNFQELSALEGNITDFKGAVQKKNFSPWGGKRNQLPIEAAWSWKRTYSPKEPTMPKRVRFSPWGGKRSGQMVLKNGSKSNKIIVSTTIPEMVQMMSKYSPYQGQYNLAGFRLMPPLDKRHQLKALALGSNTDPSSMKDALNFKAFLDQQPRLFKIGHPYSEVSLKADGKRKVKFSAWGGKRSPPIIGPIWTPPDQSTKDSTLNAILLIKKNFEKTMESKL